MWYRGFAGSFSCFSDLSRYQIVILDFLKKNLFFKASSWRVCFWWLHNHSQSRAVRKDRLTLNLRSNFPPSYEFSKKNILVMSCNTVDHGKPNITEFFKSRMLHVYFFLTNYDPSLLFDPITYKLPALCTKVFLEISSDTRVQILKGDLKLCWKDRDFMLIKYHSKNRSTITPVYINIQTVSSKHSIPNFATSLCGCHAQWGINDVRIFSSSRKESGNERLACRATLIWVFLMIFNGISKTLMMSFVCLAVYCYVGEIGCWSVNSVRFPSQRS